MPRIARLLLAIWILTAAVMIIGCSSPARQQEGGTSTTNPQPPIESPLKQPRNGLVQYSSEGNVTIDVKWMGPRDGSLMFEVAMNTHSVDLDRYDLGELAVLRDAEGEEYRPASWRSAPGGHHRRGTLAFSLPDPLSQGNAEYLEIVIRGVAGVAERVLRWEFSPE